MTVTHAPTTGEILLTEPDSRASSLGVALGLRQCATGILASPARIRRLLLLHAAGYEGRRINGRSWFYREGSRRAKAYCAVRRASAELAEISVDSMAAKYV